ncbi:MAG: hypothetical protein M1820_004031 [Bogoriella megaspora]|nr:MAG: hypothetical protein M1820_004031 [Bogoriella megaspora]
MARGKRSQPRLTESWASMSEDEDSGTTADIEDEDRTAPQTNTFIRPTPVRQSPRKKSSLSNSRSAISQAKSPLRRSSRQSSRQASAGPSNIDSLTNGSSAHMTSMDGTFVENEGPARQPVHESMHTDASFIMPTVEQVPLESSFVDPMRQSSSTTPRRRSRLPGRTTPSRDTPAMNEPQLDRSEVRQRRKSQEAKAPRQNRRRASARETPPEQEPQMFETLWRHLLHPLIRFFFKTITRTLDVIAPFLPFIFAAYVVVGIIMLSLNFATTTLSNALSPLCNLPGSTLIAPRFCIPRTEAATAPAEFEDLVTLQSAFEEVLESSSSSVASALPMDMKRSEASIRDLKHVVQHSNLPSRNELVFEFQGFIDTARAASSDLTRFGSRIGRAVDKIISTNRWTLRVIDDIAYSDAQRGGLEKFFDNMLAPFRPRVLGANPLLTQYLAHTSVIEEQIGSLVLEAEALLTILRNLDDRLDVIASVAQRDGVSVTDEKDELLANLWTLLGGNKSGVAKLNNQLKLLREMSRYRKNAWAHVSATVLKLHSIQHGLEDLRDRVAQPGLETVEIIPLGVHIENIQMGIERLETQRLESRRVDNEQVQRVLDRGKVLAGDDDSRLIEAKTVKAKAKY